MGEAEKDGKKEEAKCPKCDSDLHLVDKVGQHYCFSCETYYDHKDVVKEKPVEEAQKALPETKKEEAKEELARSKGIPCPSCGDMAAPVKDSDRYYCYACEEFFTKGGKVVPDEEEAQKASTTTIVDVAAKSEPAVEETSRASELEDMKTVLTAEETMILDILEGNKKDKDERRVCPSCGLALTYVQKYDRWYCYTCRKYAPGGPSKAEEAEEEVKCAYCGSGAEYVQKYDRWYCRTCKKYLPTATDRSAKPKEDVSATPPLCAQCGKPTTWIATYERHYCYPCKKYAPKGNGKEEGKPAPETAKRVSTAKPAGPACAYCGQPTTWIAKYERHYCYPCQKYVSKTEPKNDAAKSNAKSKPNAPACPNCKKPTTWIAKYERYYCYPCKKYVPKY